MSELPPFSHEVPELEENTKNNENSEYLGTSRAELDHYFNNHIGIILLLFQLQKEKPEEVTASRFTGPLNKFIAGLKLTISRIEDGTLKESEGIDVQILNDFLALAENINDPSDEGQIEPLIEKYNKIEKS